MTLRLVFLAALLFANPAWAHGAQLFDETHAGSSSPMMGEDRGGGGGAANEAGASGDITLPQPLPSREGSLYSVAQARTSERPGDLYDIGAKEIVLSGDLMQGGLVEGRVPPGSEVFLDDRELRVGPDGGFVFGFTRDAPPEATLKVAFPDGRIAVRTLDVEQRSYKIQRIDGLPSEMVTPPQEVLERIRRENGWVAAARGHDTPQAWYRTGFVWPAVGPISGVYGSQRVLNGEPRQPHYGVDVAAPEGTPVKAPAPGIVRLAETDLYYTGGTVIIDHGYGVSSTFLHMSAVEVEAGQEVAQGDVIGAIGATGRVTGAHLDWRINWFEERLDPQLIVGPMPGS